MKRAYSKPVFRELRKADTATGLKDSAVPA
jgi:hypothetical protein